MVELLLILSGLVYVSFLGAVLYGMIVLKRNTSDEPGTSDKFVSVIVPARNEEAGIADCLRSIVSGSLEQSMFEIIVVDDHSTDETGSVVEQFIVDHPNTRLVQLVGADTGKSAALNAGISISRGDLIATIDADCIASKSWLKSTSELISESNPIVSGAVFFKSGRGLFSSMQALEFLGLVAVGAGCIGVGYPTICNSANLTYRKSLVSTLAQNGFAVGAAADEKMLQQVSSQGIGSAAFNIDRDSFVTAEPVSSLRDFFDQRRRWAAGIADFTNPLGIVLSAIVFLFFVLLIVLTPLAVMDSISRPTLAGAWTAKILAEFCVLSVAAFHFDKQQLLWSFIPAQIFHAPYVVAASLAGFLSGHSWKGRRHS